MISLHIERGRELKKAIFESTPSIELVVEQDGVCKLLLCGESKGKHSISAKLAKNARLEITTIEIDCDTLDRDIEVELNQEGAQYKIGGIFIAKGRENIKISSTVRHNAENCDSAQSFRGVATGSAKALFRGMIYVAPRANGTTALQESHNIVLSDTAKIETQPQLEIYADDVKCNHGATVGKQNEEALFYMRQRGIELPDAQALLLESFCFSSIELNDFDEDIQARVHSKIRSAIEAL